MKQRLSHNNRSAELKKRRANAENICQDLHIAFASIKQVLGGAEKATDDDSANSDTKKTISHKPNHKMTAIKRLLDEYLARSNLYNNYFATLNSANGPFGAMGGDIGGYAGQGNYGRFY